MESGERKHLRKEIEKAVGAEHLHLRTQAEKARQALESVRYVAQDYRERFLAKNMEAPAPIFTPKEINAIELYSVRQADPKVGDRYHKLIKEAEKEGRVINDGRSVAGEREVTNRDGSEKLWSRPQSVEERRIGDAHTWTLQELKTGSQEDLLLCSPEEFTVSLAENVRTGLSERHSLSIQALGYTREAWANTVLLHVQSALSGTRIGGSGHASDQSLQMIQSMKKAIDQGDERLLTRLSGPDPRSQEAVLQERRERDGEPKWKDQILTQGQYPTSHEWEGAAKHNIQDVQENSRTERLDRLEHILTR